MVNITIGQVASQVGISTDSVRFYEHKGLIGEPPRGDNGYRQYPESIITQLKFIKRAKAMGFTSIIDVNYLRSRK